MSTYGSPSLDGREVNVTRTPPADERHSDLTFAVNDAFKHARRQLQDEVRQMQGHTKSHHDSATDHPPVRSIDNVQTNFDTNRWKRYFESGVTAPPRMGRGLLLVAGRSQVNFMPRQVATQKRSVTIHDAGGRRTQ
jgi:hypothetical protein